MSLSNCGIGNSDLHPLTLLKLYRTIVLPKALYGCELWNNLTSSQITTLERAHRFSIKFIQSLPKQTRTDIAQSIIGINSLEYEIDKKKLLLFGQLCLLNPDTCIKRIFSVRVMGFAADSRKQRGFIPDIFRLLEKYSLLDYVNSYITSGNFVSMYTWKYTLNRAVTLTVN